MQRIEQSERRLDLALQSGALGLWDWNLQTNEIFFSDRWKTMLGYAPEELRGKTWQELTPADEVGPGMKVLRINGKLPGETGYPLQ